MTPLERRRLIQARPGLARTMPPTRLGLAIGPRWRKVWGDLHSNLTRTTLVVLAIFIGVFAVGMIASSQHILTHQLRANYLATNPAHLSVSIGVSSYNSDFTIDAPPANLRGFDEALLTSMRNLPDVATAEGRRVFQAQVQTGPQHWQTIQFIALDDYSESTVNQFRFLSGSAPPDERELLIERSSLGGVLGLPATVGDDIVIELPDGTQRVLPIVGQVHDMHQWPTPFLGTVYAYITMDTLEWLGQPREFNQLLVRVHGNGSDQVHNQAVAQEVYDKIQKAGLEPSFPQVPEPNKHPLAFIITAITALMGALSVMAIMLSGFLVFNTISALLAQQVRQIGMMKALGARSSQVIGMYLALVVGFGLLALLLALPLAWLATGSFTGLIANFLNFDVRNTFPAPHVIALAAAISVLVPMLAALGPIVMGTRITVREALDSHGAAPSYGTGWLDRLLQRMRGLPRPVLLSLRNTFRRKARMALTLTTLTLGGAMFIAVFSVRSSLLATMQGYTERLYAFDIELYLERPYNTSYLISEAESLPQIVAAEAQVQTTARRVFVGDREGENVQLFALPPETRTMVPQVTEGRWLLPEDENALVISSGFQDSDPDLHVGSEIMLSIQNRETTWRIVGVMPMMGDYRWAYASYDYYGRVVHEVGSASYLRLVTDQHSPDYQREMVALVQEHFQRQGINISSTKTQAELSQGDQEFVTVLVISLMSMAVLVAVVGSLGLAGTMSLNVIERVREIGIMRAVGASNGSVLQVFMIEGIVIGLLSWTLAALLALPVSQLMSNGLGMLLFSGALNFSFSPGGLLIWLALSVVLAAVASFLPAWNASRLSVREVLAHE